MRSIRSRILVLAVVCVLLSNLVVMLTAIISVSRTVNKDSDQIIRQIAKGKQRDMNAQLALIEQSVETLQKLLVDEAVDNPGYWEDTERLEAFVQEIKSMSELTLKSTSGALCVYYRMADDIVQENAGIYLAKSGEENSPCRSVDIDNAVIAGGFYTQAMERKAALWTQPWQNEIVGKEVISYVAPMIHENRIIGIVGMDMNLAELRSLVESVDVYARGYAIVMDSKGNVVYHPSFPEGIAKPNFPENFEETSNFIYRAEVTGKISSYRWAGVKRKIVFCPLQNQMYVGITIPFSEIRKPAKIFAVIAMLVVLAVIGLAYTMSAKAAAYIVSPLQDLTEVAQKLAAGDFDINIRGRQSDEIEVLADSLQQTANKLKRYVTSLKEFAHTDSLTKVHNKAAYSERLAVLEREIRAGAAEFAVVVLDVNSLKHMNDTYGHEAGDLWITGAATAMDHAFGKSRVYRIGGDEFAVILEPTGRKYYPRMLAEFEKELDKFNNREDKIYEEVLHVACGIADFDPQQDREYADVFRRADNEMYENKKMLKGLA